jgi:hypothetical protein
MRTPLGPSLCSRPGARQQAGEFVAARGSRLQHRAIDVAFDGAYGQGQSISDFAAGQSFTDQHHDLAFPIGQRQRLAGLQERRSAGAALFGQSGGACRATQRRSPEALPSIRQGCLSSCINGGNKVAEPLESSDTAANCAGLLFRRASAGHDVTRFEVITEELKRGRQMAYSRSRIIDADRRDRVQRRRVDVT